MKRKAIAAALAALAVFGTAPVVSARHQAEEYAERVQREKKERWREAENEARIRAQAESRRRAAEERRIAEEQQRQNEMEILDDEDSEDDELIRGENIRDEAQAKTDIAEKEEQAEKEAQRVVEEIQQPEEAQRVVEEIPQPEETDRAAEETVRRQEQRVTEEAEKAERVEGEGVRTAEDTATKAAGEATDTGEGLLAKYLRAARERLQGEKPLPTQTAQAAPGLHITEPQPMKRLEVEITDGDGTLLFSDSPEYVKEPGILYSDIVKDDARVFYYHLNDTKKPYKVAVVLEEASDREAMVRVTRRAMAQPSENYLQVGKTLQEMFFSGAEEAETIAVAPRQRKLLLEAADQIVLRPGELVAGMVDFSAAAPVRVSVLFYPPDKNPLQYISDAEILPADEHHLRGTFIGMNRTLRLKTPHHPKKDGIGCVVLADGELDPYREGVDATDGSIVTNYGNYGVVYRLEVPVRATTHFFMSPMGGGYAGVVRANAGKDTKRLIAVPDNRLMFGENSVHPPFDISGSTMLLPSAELADLGIWKKKPPVFFEFSPPGASNLPILLILAPEKIKLAGGGEKKSS